MYGVFTGKFWAFDSFSGGPFKNAFVDDKVWLGEVGVLGTGFSFHPFVLIYAISGVLMISRRLRIPKI
ncbi:hypothetical protein AYI70_g11174 [Smittium culicis]|uniref:Uncharacterized protein n=1 Tax=Smittium culicis TaxID=133412 RepID=A0A1R1X342_9FUNG|nr:hypothetical protein AYI70_g11174 [Smittium culicis]